MYVQISDMIVGEEDKYDDAARALLLRFDELGEHALKGIPHENELQEQLRRFNAGEVDDAVGNDSRQIRQEVIAEFLRARGSGK